MRAALAIATVLLLVLAAAAPHAHGGPLGSHGCVACVAAGAEEATAPVPEAAPLPEQPGRVVAPRTVAAVSGAPLGAVPGQSPPIA